MGTNFDIFRKFESKLRYLFLVPDNRHLFFQYQQRLLALVMSQILDQGVAGIIADVIYECSLVVTNIGIDTVATAEEGEGKGGEGEEVVAPILTEEEKTAEEP